MGENQCPPFSLQRLCLVLEAALHFTCKYSGVGRWMLEKLLPYFMVGFSNSSEESQYSVKSAKPCVIEKKGWDIRVRKKDLKWNLGSGRGLGSIKCTDVQKKHIVL